MADHASRRIPREIIEEIRDRSDIEQIIGTYVTLKRAGSNVKGLCPFHNEKTPSMVVYPESQSFYCFGCGAGGDAITFVMKYNNLDYEGAIEYLAARCGISIPDRIGYERENSVSNKRVLEINLCAAKYFREKLFSPEGAEAMRYLTENRRLSMATIKHFGLGYAPNHPFEMINYMRSQGFTDEELKAAYIEAVSQKGNAYAIFRNRIIFPIINTSGSVIAFGGRVMDDSKPKYLNTNDTPAYKKGKNLFALNYAKDSENKDKLLLCEGYMDVIALHAAGFTNAVAGLGTALTPDQARLIARYTKKVVLVYDSDEAGQKATERALSLLTEVGVDTKVLNVTDAKDPDEFIKKFGPAAFERILGESKTKFSHRANAVLKKYNIENNDEKINAANEICGIIAMSASSVERDVYLNEASKLLDIPKDILTQDVKRLSSRAERNKRKQEKSDAYSSARGIGDKVNPDFIKNVGAAVSEEAILGLMLAFPEHRNAVSSGKVELCADDFVTAFGKRVFETVTRLNSEDRGFDIALMGEEFSPDELGRIQKMIVSRLQLSENGADVLRASAETLKSERAKQAARDSGDRLAMLAAKREQLKKKKENNN